MHSKMFRLALNARICITLNKTKMKAQSLQHFHNKAVHSF